MHIRGIVLAAALGSSMLCPLPVHALDAHTLITRCTDGGGADLQGLAAIRKACPGIDAALAQRYSGQPSSALPAASDLRAIALRLQKPPPPASSSLWDRITAWLRRRFTVPASLLKWLHSLPGWSAGPSTQGLLLVGSGVLILLALAAFIISELRAAGLLGRRWLEPARARRPVPRPRIRMPGEEADDGADPAHALDRPASALRMLIEALRRSRRIDRDGSLTCREVLVRAVFDTQGQREEFAKIALLAEQEVFGPRGASIPVPDELRPALEALRTQLLAAPAARTSAP
jgi:hypothetical protein